MIGLKPLRSFIADMTWLANANHSEADTVAFARLLLAELIRTDSWLPAQFSESDSRHYRQYLLYCDPLDRFSLVSFVWGPGQSTPVHNHTVWGLIGVLRGAEKAQSYWQDEAHRWRPISEPELLGPRQIDSVSPTIGDVHQVSNALHDQCSVSIHLYGGNIGTIRRQAFDPSSGATREFVSAYFNHVIPNVWNERWTGRSILNGKAAPLGRRVHAPNALRLDM